jgi:cytosine/adenosine deaminase-related metal-dependent hydrolase
MARILLWLAGAALLVAAALGAVVWRALRLPAPPPPAAVSFSLVDVTVVSPGRGRVEHQTLDVRGGAIRRLAPSEAADDAGPFRDLQGAFVVPGLVDLHTHLPPDNALRLTPLAGLLYLAHGVTSIRDAGDVDGTAIPAARRDFGAGGHPGPRLFACGPFVGGTPTRWKNTIVLERAEDAEAVVARIATGGFDCVKSYDGLDVPRLRALEAAADRHGLAVIGHVPEGLAYEEALIRNVQHLLGVPPPASLARKSMLDRVADWHAVDGARLDAVVQATLAHGIVNTPTLVSTHALLLYEDYQGARRDPVARLLPRLYRDVVWDPRRGLADYREMSPEWLAKLKDAYAKKVELVRRLHAAGAQLRIGTDTQKPFVVPGAAVQEEMQLFRSAGIGAEETWAIASVRAGADLPVPRLGQIEAGAPADFLVLREDPTIDPEAMKTLEAVVTQGKLYTRKQLDDALRAHRRRHGSVVFDRVSMLAARRAMRGIAAAER